MSKSCSLGKGFRSALAAISLICAGQASGQQSSAPDSSWTEETLRYLRVGFSAQPIDDKDPQFRIAEEGFPFSGGTAILFMNPAAYSIVWFNGALSSGLLSDGRAIVLWPGMLERPSIHGVRIAETAELAGQESERPSGPHPAPSWPTISGYHYVASDRLSGTDNYLGLWRRDGGSPETLIVSFSTTERDATGLRKLVVGRLPLPLNSLYVTLPLHGVSWGVTFVSEARYPQRVYFLQYTWMPSYFRPLREVRQ